MITFLHKPWIRFTLNLLPLVLLMVASGCKQTKDETWYCYNRKDNPVGDAIVICDYTLAGSGQAGVNYRLGDAKGKIFLDLDEDTPDGLIRSPFCIYSPKLRSGATGFGKRWHEGQPIPDNAVYFDEWNNKIYIKSGVDDPLIWHDALNALISAYFSSMDDPNGGPKLRRELGPVIFRERSLFLEEYGDQLVPPAYLDRPNVVRYYRFISKRKNTGLKFKDITLEIPSL